MSDIDVINEFRMTGAHGETIVTRTQRNGVVRTSIENPTVQWHTRNDQAKNPDSVKSKSDLLRDELIAKGVL